MRKECLTLHAICDTLNAEGVPTPSGGPRWWRSHVSRLLHTRGAREVSANG